MVLIKNNSIVDDTKKLFDTKLFSLYITYAADHDMASEIKDEDQQSEGM